MSEWRVFEEQQAIVVKGSGGLRAKSAYACFPLLSWGMAWRLPCMI